MKKKVLVLAAVAAMIFGIFTTSNKNDLLEVNKAYADPTSWVACVDFGLCWVVEDGQILTFLYNPIYIKPKPTVPTEAVN
jgi:hypothetical protein